MKDRFYGKNDPVADKILKKILDEEKSNIEENT